MVQKTALDLWLALFWVAIGLMAVNRNSRILVISDLHAPYQHPDAVDFLDALKKKYQPTRVISVGDETDGHAISYHERDPDLFSHRYELSAAIGALEPVYRLFSDVDVMWSNHGSLIFRQAKTAGLSADVFKPIGEIMRAPKGWVWYDDLTLTLPSGQKVFFCHGKQANALAMSQKIGMCTVNGHYHTQFSIQKWRSPVAVNWAMVVGCLIDTTSRAFHYDRNQILRPVLGCGVIIDSSPRLELMMTDARGRWTGKLFA